MALRNPDNQNPIDNEYARGINARSQGQSDSIYQRGMERLGAAELRDQENQSAANGAQINGDNTSQSKSEPAGSYVNKFTGQSDPSSGGSFIERSKARLTANKKKSISGAIIGFISILLFGGGAFFGGSLAPMAWLANNTFDLDDTFSAGEVRSSILKIKKIRPTSATTLGCGRFGSNLPIKCKYATMTEKMKRRYANSGIEITGEKRFGNRLKPTEFTFKGSTFTPEQFSEEVRRPHSELGRAAVEAQSTRFNLLSGPNFVKKTLGKWNLSKSKPPLQGSIDERLDTLSNRTDSDTLNNKLRYVDAVDPETGEPLRDGDGNPYKRLEGDTNGKLWTQAKIDGINAKAIERVRTFKKPLARGALGVSVLGWYDTGCTIVKTIGAASIGVKVANAAQLAGYAMPVAALADSLKSGDISNEDAQVIQKFMNDTDARQTLAGLIENDKGELIRGEVPNPDFGKSATDSELYKMSVNGGVAKTSVVDARYSLGFGVNSLAKKAESFARVANSGINLGGLNACDKVQSWWGRAGGLIAGVVVGGFTLGGSTVISTAANASLIVLSLFIDDILHAVLSSNLIGEDMSDAPVEKGTAAWTGLAAIHSQHALSRGMMPGNANQIVAYQVKQNEARQEYIAFERQQANPLDLKNPYSIAGTTALAIQNRLPNNFSISSLASLPTVISSFVYDGLIAAIKPSSVQAAKLNPERFKRCDDEAYKAVGIDADVQCNVRYVMPASSMKLDPIEVAQWMEDERYVEADTTTGLPKGYEPLSEAENHNIAMSFVMGQIDSIYNTRKYGDTDKGKEYGMFLDFCVNRTLPFGETYDENGSFGDASPEWKSGEKCMDTEDEKINYFRMYTFDQSVNDDLDESPITNEINCGPSGGSGSTGNTPTVEAINDRIAASEATNGWATGTSPLGNKGQILLFLGFKKD